MNDDGPVAWLSRAGALASAADGAEAAMRAILQVAFDQIGDREAHLRPAALGEGKRQYFVAGAFLITPDRAYHMLVGNIGFPPEQERLLIPIEAGHPGHVALTREPLLLDDTEADGRFRQYLRTSRMGSAIYAPFFWDGAILGQIVVAAQARWTMRPADLGTLIAFSRLAAAVWVARDGPGWLAATYPPANAWIVEPAGIDPS